MQPVIEILLQRKGLRLCWLYIAIEKIGKGSNDADFTPNSVGAMDKNANLIGA